MGGAGRRSFWRLKSLSFMDWKKEQSKSSQLGRGPVDSLHTGMGGDTEQSNGNRMFSYRNSRNFWSSLSIYSFILGIQSMNE